MVPCGYVVVVAVVSSLVQISSNRGFLSNSQFAADNSCHQDCEEKLIIKKNTIIHDIYIYTDIKPVHTHTLDRQDSVTVGARVQSTCVLH